jgi:hypothetical protein
MAAENEMQDYFNKVGEAAGAAYNAAMRDGSIPGIAREAVKDVRNTLNEVFFGHGERGGEPGAPLNPLFHDIVQARKSHDVADGPGTAANDNATPVASPGELAEGKSVGGVAGEQPRDLTQQSPSPGDLAEGKGGPSQEQGQAQQQQSQRHGMRM